MKFALDKTTRQRLEPQAGLIAICPNCEAEVIAKCGSVRVHHWAHRNVKACDSWWEPETEWHRAWKNNFPSEWQEIILPDERTGEKHIADVRTTHGVVLEFQHSHIKPQQRTIREGFYKKMVWIVDGTRLKRDYPRFLKASAEFRKTNKPGVFFVDFPEECFPSAWLESSVQVLFDFRGVEPINDRKDYRHNLYCLFPVRNGRYAILGQIPREYFINSVISGEWLLGNEKSRPKEPEQQNQIVQPTSQKIVRKESEYFLHRGKFKKRWRF